MASTPKGVANALYQVPRLCRGNAPQSSLSGTLPTRELTVEFLKLIIKSHENGYRVVSDETLGKIKRALLSPNLDDPDPKIDVFELAFSCMES